MPRPPLAIGTYGSISRTEVAPGRWVARCRYRDVDGVTRKVEAYGKSGAAAERALKTALLDRSAPLGREISPDMRLSTVAALWFDELTSDGRLRPQSIDTYRLVWSGHLERAVGSLRVREATVSRVDAVIKAITASKPGQAKHARVVMSGILSLCVRHDALPSNPVRSIARGPSPAKPITTVDLALLDAVRRAAREHRTRRDEHGRLPPGPRPDGTLPAIIDVLLATGGRLGEICGLRWADVELGDTPTVTFTGTVVSAKGYGLFRQPRPKTDSGYRTVVLPRFAVDVLLQRQVEATSTPYDLVFPSRRGTPLDPRNVARSWRAVRAEAGLEGVTLHAFRRTVATLIAAESGSERAAAQLGHSAAGGVATTLRHYIQRPEIAPDSSAVLERLGPTDRHPSSRRPSP